MDVFLARVRLTFTHALIDCLMLLQEYTLLCLMRIALNCNVFMTSYTGDAKVTSALSALNKTLVEGVS